MGANRKAKQMNIVIVGAGKVGKTIAKKLTYEGHDVVIIDNNADVLSRSSNEMDAICIDGNGADYRVQRDAGVSTADILIAATAHDEVNMLCCLIAHKLGAKRTIARVRDPIYSAQMDYLKEELGLSLSINPELAAAEEISRLLRIPSALNAEVFAQGKVELIGIRLDKDNPLCDMILNDIYKRLKIKLLVCAVQRGSECFIPNGDFMLQAGDKIHITAPPEELAKFLRTTVPEKKRKVKAIMICGGGRIAYYLTKMLEKLGTQVKIVETNPQRAAFLSEEFPHALVICGDNTDHDMLLEEGIDSTDAFIALTGMDETNIITGLSAKWQGASSVIVKVNNEDLIGALPESALDAIISPKQITANKILAFVRAMSCSPEESNVETVHELLGGRIEALEFIARGSHPMYGVPLKKLGKYLRKDLLIACIVRHGKAIIPGGEEFIRTGDRVIIVTKQKMFNDLADILTGPVPQTI